MPYATARNRELERRQLDSALALTVLVENGQIIERNLRRERMTPEEVAAEARLHQIPNIQSIRWAVLESSGKISFIPR